MRASVQDRSAKTSFVSLSKPSLGGVQARNTRGSDYRARYYDPAAGRFLGEDPIRFGIGPTIRIPRFEVTSHLMTSDALNGRSSDFYSYVSNDPVGKADPRGLWQVTVGAGWGYGALITFGDNGGQWNFGLDVGGGIGAFIDYDSNDEDCECGANAHLEGDLGIVDLDDIGVELNVNQNFESSGELSLSLSQMGIPNVSIPFFNPGAAPTFGIGAGLFSGGGYTWCF